MDVRCLLRSSPLFSFVLPLCGLLAEPGPAAAAPESAAAMRRYADALRTEQADALRLIWTRGAAGAAATQRLRIEDGRAQLERCSDACQTVGAPLLLSSGERGQLLSRLRSAGLESLRDSDPEVVADRQLEVAVASVPVGQWRLPRADWPTPPDGYGVAELLDDLGRRIEQTAARRAPIAVPSTVAELHAVRLQLRLRPRNRPGGLVLIENGQLQVTPEEGSLPRTPRPQPFTRPSTPEEEQRLLAALKSARLDELDGLVEKRAQPAIGDDDGRLATLHILPTDEAASKKGAIVGMPRGYERYLADLQRSPAAPLIQELLGYLITESAAKTAAAPQPPAAQGAARRRR